MKRKEYLMVFLIIITFLFTGCLSGSNLPTDSGERLIEVSIDRLEVYNLLSSVYNYRNSYFVIKVDSTKYRYPEDEKLFLVVEKNEAYSSSLKISHELPRFTDRTKIEISFYYNEMFSDDMKVVSETINYDYFRINEPNYRVTNHKEGRKYNSLASFSYTIDSL